MATILRSNLIDNRNLDNLDDYLKDTPFSKIFDRQDAISLVYDNCMLFILNLENKIVTLVITNNFEQTEYKEYVDIIKKHSGELVEMMPVIYIDELTKNIMSPLKPDQYRLHCSLSSSSLPNRFGSTTFEYSASIKINNRIFHLSKQLGFNTDRPNLKLIKQTIKSYLSPLSKLVKLVQTQSDNLEKLHMLISEINFRYCQDIQLFSVLSGVNKCASLFKLFNENNPIDFEELELYTEYKFVDYGERIFNCIDSHLKNKQSSYFTGSEDGNNVIYSKYSIRITCNYSVGINLLGRKIKYNDPGMKTIFMYLSFIGKFEEFITDIEKFQLTEA